MKFILTESQFKCLLESMTAEEVDFNAYEANLTPTEKQVKAGNYKMGHIKVHGFDITIENPRGSKRYHKDGYTIMKNHYGYFSRTKGKDGDQVDVFLGPHIEDFDTVYVVDQNNREGGFDESKVMLGFDSADSAKRAYLSNYSPGWKGFREIHGVSVPIFKQWLYRGRKQRKPFGEYLITIKNDVTKNKR